jgi:putative phosphoribosyl transferase
LAMGAVASGEVRVLNKDVVERLEITGDEIDTVAAKEVDELSRRERLYRSGRPLRDIRGCIVIVVDDGLATGATMRAAIAALRQLQPARIVVAVPTAAPDTAAEIGKEADDIVCVITPEGFLAVGQWYEDFEQTSDAEVKRLLAAAQQRSLTPDS